MAFERPISIKEVINNIHRKKYLLPAIQREFVWQENQIEWLFDSLMRDYPVGSFLFWDVPKENSENFKFYEFIREFHEKNNRHNPIADIKGEEDITAILDGQQRMTSLYIGLKGSYASKLPNKRRENDASYPKKELYINLLVPSETGELEYDFRFLTVEQASVNNDYVHWFKVGNILNITEQYELNEYLIDNGLNMKPIEASKFANRTIFKLHKIIHETPCINYYLEKDKELNKVLQIFIRVNSGGIQLSYSDLLLSIATASWKTKDARETITSFVDELNNIGEGFDFDKDFVLKTSLVLCDFSDIAFKVDNFNSANMLKIENEWDKIEDALRLAVYCVESFGYNYKSLTSNYVLIPIAYYLYKKGNPKDFVTSIYNLDERKQMHRFVAIAILKKLFGGQPDNVLRPIREIIRQSHEQFPFELIRTNLKVTNKSLKMDEEELSELLYTQYGSNYSFSVLSLLYPTLDYRNHFHQDHIFPKSLLSSKSKLKKLGLSDEMIEYCVNNFNYIGNLQLIEGNVNQQKSTRLIEEWINIICLNNSEKNEYKKKHYIPDIELTVENFENFLEQRELLILTKLKSVLID